MKKILVLSGGAARGAFQVGCLSELAKHNIRDWDLVAGTSVGALNGAMVAQEDLSQLIQLWSSIENHPELIYTSTYLKDGKLRVLNILWTILKRSVGFNWALAIFSRKYRKKALSELLAVPSLLEMDPLDKLIQKHILQAKIRIPFYAGVVSLRDGHHRLFSVDGFHNDQEFTKGILASTIMPGIMPVVPLVVHDKRNYFDLADGGLRNISPLQSVLNLLHAETPEEEAEIFVINCNVLPKPPYRFSGFLDSASRGLEILTNEILRQDIQISRKASKQYRIHILFPGKSLGGSLDFSRKSLQSSFSEGEAAVHKFMEAYVRPE